MSDANIVLGVDASEVDTALDAILAETQIVGNQVEDVEAERQEVEQRVKDTVAQSNQSLRRALAFSRRVAGSIRAVLSSGASAADQIFASLAEAVLLTAEVLIDVATAESLTIVGAVGATLKIAMAYKLIQKADAIRRQQTEEVAALEREIQIISPWTYGFIIDPLLFANCLLFVLGLWRLFHG